MPVAKEPVKGPKREVKKRAVKKVKESAINSPYTWLENIEKAHKARTQFLEEAKNNPKLIENIVKDTFKELMRNVTKYTIEASKTAPVINIDVTYYGNYGFAGFTRIDDIPRIGRVYFNIIMHSSNNTHAEITKYHEEEHARSNLYVRNLKKPSEIKTLNDVKEKLREELLARIAESTYGFKINIDPNSQQHYETIIYGLFGHLNNDLWNFFSIYLTNNKYSEQSWEHIKTRDKIRDQIQNICMEIFKSSKYLTTNEIMMLLRQNDFDNLIKALKERIKIKKTLFRKKEN